MSSVYITLHVISFWVWPFFTLETEYTEQCLDEETEIMETQEEDTVSVEELLARLRVTQRRLAVMQAGTMTNAALFTNGNLKVDFAAGCAYLKGEELHLTPIEYKILCLMARNVGKVLTHTYITQQVWGSSWENDIASLRVFMATLRKKLEAEQDSPQYIQTHIGIGYRMMKVE